MLAVCWSWSPRYSCGLRNQMTQHTLYLVLMVYCGETGNIRRKAVKSLVLWEQEHTPLNDKDFLGGNKACVDLQTKGFWQLFLQRRPGLQFGISVFTITFPGSDQVPLPLLTLILLPWFSIRGSYEQSTCQLSSILQSGAKDGRVCYLGFSAFLPNTRTTLKRSLKEKVCLWWVLGSTLTPQSVLSSVGP